MSKILEARVDPGATVLFQRFLKDNSSQKGSAAECQ